ncbi:hypothetical protein H9P43_009543 [Blastocladiella emersonii ATCC 22665]|nr:hypothetical protein H9P43_009543 [Blastocladiella emersonii ATCC 22665]
MNQIQPRPPALAARRRSKRPSSSQLSSSSSSTPPSSMPSPATLGEAIIDVNAARHPHAVRATLDALHAARCPFLRRNLAQVLSAVCSPAVTTHPLAPCECFAGPAVPWLVRRLAIPLGTGGDWPRTWSAANPAAQPSSADPFLGMLVVRWHANGKQRAIDGCYLTREVQCPQCGWRTGAAWCLGRFVQHAVCAHAMVQPRIVVMHGQWLVVHLTLDTATPPPTTVFPPPPLVGRVTHAGDLVHAVTWAPRPTTASLAADWQYAPAATLLADDQDVSLAANHRAWLEAWNRTAQAPWVELRAEDQRIRLLLTLLDVLATQAATGFDAAAFGDWVRTMHRIGAVMADELVAVTAVLSQIAPRCGDGEGDPSA